MADLKLTTLSSRMKLFKSMLKKLDTNGDGDLSSPEAYYGGRYVMEHGKSVVAGNPNRQPITPESSIKGAAEHVQDWAKQRYGVSMKDMFEAVDDLEGRIKAADKNGDGVLDATERKSAERLVSASWLLDFTDQMAGKSISDFNFPSKRTSGGDKAGYFDYRGTAKEVAKSLLDAYSRKSNDNFWPSWSGQKSAVRYVVDDKEATAMVDALKKLYVSKQKSIVAELARRNHASREIGCLACTSAGAKVFADYAKSLGLTGLNFDDTPMAPPMPSPD